MTRARKPALVGCLLAGAVLAPLGWFWQASLLPDSYSVMDMGYLDHGGGPAVAHAGGAGMAHAGHGASSVDVPDLTADHDRPADVRVEIVARAEEFTVGDGRAVDGFTLNGTSPGPVIEATEGDLLEVELRNESVPDGTTLHWHGVDVPNAADGVAGVTQDAVGEGESFTYRFIVDQAGTYWYHSHQVSHVQVREGLFGALVVHPAEPEPGVVDVTAVTHLYGGTRTLNGAEGDVPVEVDADSPVRVRVVNTDNAPVEVWADDPFAVVAVDATDVNGPTPVTGRSLTVTAGGRADLKLTVPADGSRIQVGGSTALVLGPAEVVGSGVAEVTQPERSLDLLTYGEPAALGLDPEEPDRRFDYSIGRRPGFLDGRPGLWWTINGHMFPNIPMYVVREGDVVVMRIENHSGEVHPMHLHGHHAVVLSRDGEPATGAPWWVDSLNVLNGETYEIAFVADNPGVWMDHCHNLPHAAEGLMTHLMYEGVHTPFVVGGAARNEPE